MLISSFSVIALETIKTIPATPEQLLTHPHSEPFRQYISPPCTIINYCFGPPVHPLTNPTGIALTSIYMIIDHSGLLGYKIEATFDRELWNFSKA